MKGSVVTKPVVSSAGNAKLTDSSGAAIIRVVHINTWDSVGGAARAAFRLHKGLGQSGNISRMVVGWKAEAGLDIDPVMEGDSLSERVVRKAVSVLDKRLSLQYLFLPWQHKFLNHSFIQTADIIHLHNIHSGYFPYRIIPKLSRIAPIVWSLHDMWAFSGHCTYSHDCNRWQSGCGLCPRLNEPPELTIDTSALHWGIKKRVYEKVNMSVVTGSSWMADMVKKSPLLGHCKIETIPYGSDLSMFRETNKAFNRATLRIPEKAKVILVFASPMKRKGSSLFVQALRKLSVETPPWILIVGGQMRDIPSRFPKREIGYLNSDDMLNLCYGAADFFVLPTLAENFPLSVLDASAAGLASIAFDVGGMRELIKSRETGLLVPPSDTDELSRAINELLTENGLCDRLGENARKRTGNEYGLTKYVNGYLSLYRQLIALRQEG